MKTIPKICHLYWDRSPMALLQVFTVTSFHRYNPDWHIIVYLTKQPYNELGPNTFVPDYTNKDYFHMVRALDYVEFKEIDLVESEIITDIPAIQSSDIFRRQILYKYGGVYSDFDTIWLKPMEQFENIDCMGNASDFETIVCLLEYTKGFSNVSNLVSEPGSPYIKSLLDAEKLLTPPYGHLAFGTSLVDNTYPTLDSAMSKFPRLLAIKYETFYPYSILNMQQLYLQNDLTPLNSKNVIGLHWFNGNVLSKGYINNEDYGRKCSMTSILKREGYI
jgi:hypothetical protein